MRKTIVCRIGVIALAVCAFLATDSAEAALQWGRPIRLSAPGEQASTPRLAVNGEGGAVALWVTGYFEVESFEQGAVRLGVSTAWRALLAPPYVPAGKEPEVTIDANGRVIVVRTHEGVLQSESGSSRRNMLSQPINVSGARATARSPHIAVDLSGNAVAAWGETDWPEGHEHMIEVSSRSHVTGVWREPVVLATLGQVAEGEGPQVAVNARGDAVVVWTGNTLGPEASPVIQAAFWPAGGRKWSKPVNVAPESQFGTSQPRVGIDAQGDIVIAWEASEAEGTRVDIASKPASGRAWRAPVDLGSANPDPSGLQLAVSSSGHVAVIWERRAAATRSVVAVSGSVSAGKWLGPVRLAKWHQQSESPPSRCKPAPMTACPQIRQRFAAPGATPQIALDAGGDAVAVWEQAEDRHSGGVIQAAVKPAGSHRWREPMRLSGVMASEPTVAFERAGEAVVVWQRISHRSGAIVEADIRGRGVK